MESNKTFRIIVIVTVSTLVTFFRPVESKYFARSLLSELESPSPAPAPGPEVMKPITSPANSPAEIDIDSPTASPADSISPTNAPADIDIDSPAASPEAPSDSMSPTEVDIGSPAASPEAPADSISLANPPSEENPETLSPNAQSGMKLLSSPKDLLHSPLLSPEIKNICGKTDFPPLCESSVSPLLTPQLKPDTSSVLILAIQASINATKAAMATVEKVAAADCQELYDDAVSNLEDALNAINSRDIGTVKINLSAAMTDYGTCNDGFEEAGEPNPLAGVADHLTKMVTNCLVISTLMT